MILVDERSAGEIAVHDHLEDVVVQAGKREIPVAFIALVQEIEAVFALHPANLDLDVQLLRIVSHSMALFGIHELIHGDGVTVGHDVPIVGVAIDARLQVGRELKHLEGYVLPFQGRGRNRQESQKRNSQQGSR